MGSVRVRVWGAQQSTYTLDCGLSHHGLRMFHESEATTAAAGEEKELLSLSANGSPDLLMVGTPSGGMPKPCRRPVIGRNLSGYAHTPGSTNMTRSPIRTSAFAATIGRGSRTGNRHPYGKRVDRASKTYP